MTRRRAYAILAGVVIVGGVGLLLLRPDLAGAKWTPLLLLAAAVLAALAVKDDK